MYDVGTCFYSLLRTRLCFLRTRLAVAGYISVIVYRSSLQRPNARTLKFFQGCEI